MGALHEGHMALVAAARDWLNDQGGGYLATSIFVNPTQFGPKEDLASYPRDEEKDLVLLEQAGCDAVLLPTVERAWLRLAVFGSGAFACKPQ
jgi:pantoate--beta-alanine ligase